MPTYVIYGDVSDGDIVSSDVTYATARAGSGLTASDLNINGRIGQWLNAGTFLCYEGFLAFDTSPVGGATVTSAVLSLMDLTDGSLDDFTIECRLFDWGATLTTADWVAGASISETLLATYPTSSGWTGSIYHDLTDVAMAANINGSGFTRFRLNSDRHRLGTTPTQEERIAFDTADNAGTTQDPKLTVITVTPLALSGTVLT